MPMYYLHVRIKLSKMGFLHILKLAIKRACNHTVMYIEFQISTTLLWQDRSRETNLSNRTWLHSLQHRHSMSLSAIANQSILWLHYDEANDLALCHICIVAYKDGKLNSHTLDNCIHYQWVRQIRLTRPIDGSK